MCIRDSNQKSDEWWVHYTCKYCIWKPVAARLQNALALISVWIRSIVIKVSFLRSICKFSRLLNILAITIKFADLHSMGAWCFYATPTHLPKLRFSYNENISVQACEGALQGFIFESSFANDTFFNAFVLFLVLNLANDWRFLGFYCNKQCSKYTIKHPLALNFV